MLLVISGLLYSLLPDALINLKLGNISKNKVQIDMLLKLIPFLLVYVGIDYISDKYVTVLVGILFLMNIYPQFCIYSELNKADILKEQIIGALKNLPDIKTEAVLKYLIIHIFNIVLFYNMQDNLIMIITFGLICCAIHFYTSEKIICILCEKEKVNINRIRIILWSICGLNIVSALVRIEVIVYLTLGAYWVFVSDTLIEKETSIIKSRKDKKEITNE